MMPQLAPQYPLESYGQEKPARLDPGERVNEGVEPGK